MLDEPMFADERIKIYVDRDFSLRSHEYAIVMHNREGEEVGAFTFYVSDASGRLTMGPFIEASKFGLGIGK